MKKRSCQALSLQGKERRCQARDFDIFLVAVQKELVAIGHATLKFATDIVHLHRKLLLHFLV
jgi:hypothetical protein